MNDTRPIQDAFLAPSWLTFCHFAPNKLAPSVIILRPHLSEWWPSDQTYLRYESTGFITPRDVLARDASVIAKDFPGANRIAVIDRPRDSEDMDYICMANWHNRMPTRIHDKVIWPIARTGHAYYILITNNDHAPDLRIVIADVESGRSNAPRIIYIKDLSAYRVPTLISDPTLTDKINAAISNRSPGNALKALRDVFFSDINPTLDHAIVTGPDDPLMDLKERPLSVSHGTLEEMKRAIEMACQLSAIETPSNVYRFSLGKDSCAGWITAKPADIGKLETFITRNLLPIFKPDGVRLKARKDVMGIKSAYKPLAPILDIPKSVMTSHETVGAISSLTDLLTTRGNLTQEAARREVESLMMATD